MEILLSNPLLFLILLVNILVVFLVTVLFLRLDKISSNNEELARVDFKLKKRISGKIGDLFDEKFGHLAEGATKNIEAKLNAQIDLILSDATKQSKELAAYIQEQEAIVVKENQFLIANNILKLQKELEKYKRDQLARVDHEITQIVFAAAREVLGRAISLSEHEDLVSKALDRAKRDQFFT